MRLRAQIAVIAIIPIVGMAVMSAMKLQSAVQTAAATEEVIETVERAIPLGNLVNELQRERGMSAGYIGSQGRNFADHLQVQRAAVDRAISDVEAMFSETDEIDESDVRAVLDGVSSAVALREDITGLEVTVPDVAAAYTAAVRATLALQQTKLTAIVLGSAAKVGAGWVALSEAKEAAGLERATGASGLGSDAFDLSALQRLWGFGAVQSAQLKDAELFTKDVLGSIQFTSFPEYGALAAVRHAITEAEGRVADVPTSATEWFTISSDWIERLRTVEIELGAKLEALARAEMQSAVSQAWMSAGLVAIAFGSSLIGFLWVGRSMMRRTNGLIRAMRQTAEKDFGANIPCLKEGSEFGDLARSLDDMRTELQAANETLTEAFAKSFAYGDSDAAMVIVDPDRRIVSANAAANRLFCDQVHHFRQIWPDFDPSNLTGHVVDGIFGGQGEGSRRLPDAENLPWRSDVNVGALKLEMNVSFVATEAGGYAGNVLQLRDVTTERLHSGMIAAIERDQCIVELSTDGIVERMNEVIAESLGCSSSEVIGRPFGDFLAPDDPLSSDLSGFWRKIVSGKGETPRLKLLQKGKDVVWLRTTINPVRDGDGQAFKISLIGEDITFGIERYREETEAKEDAVRSQRRIVESLAGGLSRVSSGDLTYRIEEPFEGDFDALRVDFNKTVEQLSDVMSGVLFSANKLRGSSLELSSASSSLAKRTESQAATLTQSAAALEEISASIQSTATDSEAAEGVVLEAKAAAEDGGRTVESAIAAMDHISTSSNEISKIISVIDDISFQTNLLALNAGVEAARAGEAGRGFAVVASEVRGLAQRAAEAAHEIKALITKSSVHVDDGVALVGRAGDALRSIAETVITASERVSGIRHSTGEQAIAISEVNTSVNVMDQTTQQNAAMAEEATAMSQTLKMDADELHASVSAFKTEESSGSEGAHGSGQNSFARSA